MRHTPRAIARELWPDGHLANCFCPRGSPAYDRVMAIIDSGQVPAASRLKWPGATEHDHATMRECVQLEGDRGVWVPIGWLP